MLLGLHLTNITRQHQAKLLLIYCDMTIGSIHLLVRPIIEAKLSVTALSFPNDSEALISNTQMMSQL